METIEQKRRQQRGEAIEQIDKIIDRLQTLVRAIADSSLDSPPWEDYVKQKLHWIELDVGWIDEAIKKGYIVIKVQQERQRVRKKGDKKNA